MILNIKKIIAILAIAATSAPFASFVNAAEAVYLVRHAEKENDGTRDPKLTDKGAARAESFIQLLANSGVTHVLSTNYQRTRLTAEPLAHTLGLEVEFYDPSDLAAVADEVKNRDGVFFIVGHSNTTPELAEALSGTWLGDIVDTAELSEYQWIYAVHFNAEGAVTKAIRTDQGSFHVDH